MLRRLTLGANQRLPRVSPCDNHGVTPKKAAGPLTCHLQLWQRPFSWCTTGTTKHERDNGLQKSVPNNNDGKSLRLKKKRKRRKKEDVGFILVGKKTV